MASRPIVPQPQRGNVAVAGAKQKAAAADGRNRRALGDIGNLVPVQGLEGKPQAQFTRPVTRNFCAQVLANAQAAAAENNRKTVEVVIDGRIIIGEAIVGQVVAEAKEAQVKVETKPNAEEVTKQGKPVSSRPSREKSSRKKKVQTFSSILSARSRVACGISYKSKDPILNIDAEDVDNHLAVVEYVEDIYEFYKLAENEFRVHNYMDSQPDINEKMRAILVDWLIEVHGKFELMPETLYLTIYIVDRFLSMKTIPRKELQLVGISAMLLACKYEEIWAPEVNDFVCISDKAYTREQILAVENAILYRLEWTLTIPTPYVFLVRFIKASVYDQEMENLVFFLAELGLMNYTTIMYRPSLIAASAVYAARCTLKKNPFWSETLKHHTGFSEPQLLDCAKLLVSFHSMAAEESKLKAVYMKYSNPICGSVALLPPAS